jgi:hypothetical protein
MSHLCYSSPARHAARLSIKAKQALMRQADATGEIWCMRESGHSPRAPPRSIDRNGATQDSIVQKRERVKGGQVLETHRSWDKLGFRCESTSAVLRKASEPADECSSPFRHTLKQQYPVSGRAVGLSGILFLVWRRCTRQSAFLCPGISRRQHTVLLSPPLMLGLSSGSVDLTSNAKHSEKSVRSILRRHPPDIAVSA